MNAKNAIGRMKRREYIITSDRMLKKYQTNSESLRKGKDEK